MNGFERKRRRVRLADQDATESERKWKMTRMRKRRSRGGGRPRRSEVAQSKRRMSRLAVESRLETGDRTGEHSRNIRECRLIKKAGSCV